MSEAVYKNHAIRNTIKQILALRTDEEILRLPTPLTDDQQWQYDRIFEIMRIKVSVHLLRCPGRGFAGSCRLSENICLATGQRQLSADSVEKLENRRLLIFWKMQIHS